MSELRQRPHSKPEPVIASSVSFPRTMPTDVCKPKLSWVVKNWLCQSKPVKSGRGDCLLKGTDINVRNQGFEIRLSVLTMVCAWVLSCVWLFATPWTIVHQVPLSKGIIPANTGMSCYFLLPGIFLTQGSNPSLAAPALTGKFFTTESPYLKSSFTVVWNWNSTTGRKLKGS